MVTPRIPKPLFRECRTRLQARRLELGLTLREMAVLIGVRPGTYTSWDYGNTWPRSAVHSLLESHLGESVPRLMEKSAVALDPSGRYHLVDL